jgi:hypothetical protein
MVNQVGFLAVHNQMLEVAEEVYATGDTSKMEVFLHPAYHGYFGTRKNEKAEYYSYEESLEGMRQTAKAATGLKSGFANRYVRMPSDSEAIVFYEKSMDFGNSIGYAMVMEVWRRVDGKWVIVREVVESA